MRKAHNRRRVFEELNARHMLSANAELLLDINEEQFGSSLLESFDFVEHDGYFYFSANDGIVGTELWRSDGTTEGTELVADINLLAPADPISNADSRGSFPTEFVVYKDEVYFAATNEDGDELWKTDGTESGTVQVKDIWEGDGDSFPAELTVFNDQLYFLASTEAEGSELWVSDGTSEGTELFVDIYEGELHSNAQQLFVFQDEMYFSAIETGDTTPELWKTDGTQDGTVLVKDINPDGGSFPEAFFEFNGELYFIAAESLFSDGSLVTELFKTDGTAEGTVVVSEGFVTLNWTFEPNVIEFNGHIYYSAIVEGRWELYRTDGTPGTSELVSGDIAAPSEFTVFQNELYFAAADQELGRQIYKTNGELGEANETQRLTEVPDPDFNGMFPTELTTVGGQVFANGFDGTETYQVWTTIDGETFEPITAFTANANSNDLNLFFEFDGRVFFSRIFG